MVFVYAAYAGATVFLAEKRDQAFEYLFSLPASRRRILVSKILPRLGWLIVLYIILTLLTKAPFFSSTGLMLAFVFLASLFLSLAIESVVVGLLGILILSGLHYLTWPTFAFIAWKLGLISTPSSSAMVMQLLSVLILFCPFGVAFWIVFQRLDAKPLKLQMRPYYLISLPSLLVIISIIMKYYGNYLAVLRKR